MNLKMRNTQVEVQILINFPFLFLKMFPILYKVILLGMISSSRAGILDVIGMGNSSCGQSTCLEFSNSVAGSFPFNSLCMVSEPLLLFANINLVCSADCRCTHGAASGGACGPSPDVPLTQTCLCNYTNPEHKPFLSIVSDKVCAELNLGPGRLVELCGTPLEGADDGGIICQNDCGCFHGANGTCHTASFPTPLNPFGEFSYCHCDY